MIPAFEENGNLPSGVYKATRDEIQARFGSTSARRKFLMTNLEQIIDLARSTDKLDRVFIWGSFVTEKSFPGDIDILLIMNEDFDLDTVEGDVKSVFDHLEGRIAFNADIFWAKSSIGEQTIDLWLTTYQLTRDYESRGIIEVDIHD